MTEIISESKNYVIFKNLEGRKILYEKIYNTFHDAEKSDISKLTDVLDNEDVYVKFKRKSLSELESSNFEKLVLSATEKCNLRCGYCIYSGKYDHERTHSNKELDFETAKKAVDFYINHAERPNIGFYGGEPLLNKKLISNVVDYVKNTYPDKKVGYSLTTNFTLADKCLDLLIDNDFIIGISLNGPREIHDKWRKNIKGKGTFDKIVENIKKLKNKVPEQYNNKVGFNITVTNPTELIQLYEFFSQPLFKEQEVNVNVVEKRGLSEEVKQELFGYDIQEAKNKYSQLAKTYSENIMNNVDNSYFLRGFFDLGIALILRREKGKINPVIESKGQCLPGFLNLFVDVDGNYCVCEKIGNKLSVGDVDKGFDFQKSLEVYNKYLDIKEEVCNDCWSVRLCNSCALTAKEEDKISVEGQKKMCNSLKSQIVQNLDVLSYLLTNDSEKNYKKYFENIKIT